ncbi:MAG: aspartyl protease family protein [Candidatus Eisenbacteria bacterium]|nr:aspartyl protease family protein [Candidatus Eisenbacteria bacterium]
MRNQTRVTLAGLGLLALSIGAGRASADAARTGGSHLTDRTNAADEISAVRTALGWDSFATSTAVMVAEGEAQFLGTDTSYRLAFDASGRFIESFDGPLPQWTGNDGERYWMRDWSNTPRELVHGERAQAEVASLFATGRWCLEGTPLHFSMAGTSDENVLELGFTHLDSVTTGTIAIDRKSHLPLRVTYGSGSSPTTLTFRDHARTDGLAYPRAIESVQDSILQRTTIRSLRREASGDPRRFKARLDFPTDVRFVPHAPAAVEVKRVSSGHLLVKPLVNGKDLGWFIFDSGAGTNCISTAVTEGNLAVPIGEIGARGVGGTVKAHFWRADSLSLGPMRVTTPLFMELELAFLEQYFGVPVAGILGFEFLSRCVAELDMTAASISLFDSRTYALPAEGRWEPVVLHERVPCVGARFEGANGLYRLDTGAAGETVALHYQVVHDHRLTEGRDTKPAESGGVGGNVRTLVGPVRSFILGGHEFRDIQASFATEDKGALSDDYLWGNIGGDLLAPFRLTFDYPGGRLGFTTRRED